MEEMPETVVVMLLLNKIHQHSRVSSTLLLLRTHSRAASSGPSSAGLIALVLLPVGKDVADAERR